MKQVNLLLMLAIIWLALFSSTEILAANKSAEVSARGQSEAEQKQAMANLHRQLSASSQTANRHTIHLTADDLGNIFKPDVDPTGRLKVGVHRSVGKSISNIHTDLIISIPGAPAIRLELTHVKGVVSVFNNIGQAREYSADGFTHTFIGDEVRVRGAAHVAGAGAVNMGGNLCSFNAPCTENAQCATMPVNISTARNAYASILFKSGRYYYVCSGGLIADSDTNSEIPYFLTANHCVSKGREAYSVETFFQYVRDCSQTDGCFFPNSDTIGSTIVATDRQGDYSLLRLSGTPPQGAVYLGWNSEPIAHTNGADLYRISHPGGAPQAYSTHQVDTGAGTCTSWPRGSWIYSRDTFGATEGGSSGSPVLNSNAEVVGQLSGACGFNAGSVCDNTSNATVDGAFAGYFPEISPFIEDTSPNPPSSGCTTDVDGDDWCAIPEGNDCDDNDSEINPDAKDRGGRKWSDGIDNDCDGVVDS